MFIALVGMSGCGKSKWGRKLRDELGFNLYSCDAIIESYLENELAEVPPKKLETPKKPRGNQSFFPKGNGYLTPKQGTEALAEWMGTPFDSRYPETKKRYLQLEKEALLQAMKAIENAKHRSNLADRPNIVIDTTGSVIYLDVDTLAALRSLATVVYLETPPMSYDSLCRRYLHKPKPIVWDHSFHIRPGEDRHTTLARCLKDLIQNRLSEYQKLAHVRLDFDNHNAVTMHSSEFIDKITTVLNSK